MNGIDIQNVDFQMLLSGFTFKILLIHKEIENYDFWMFTSWTFPFFPIHDSDEKLEFWILG